MPKRVVRKLLTTVLRDWPLELRAQRVTGWALSSIILDTSCCYNSRVKTSTLKKQLNSTGHCLSLNIHLFLMLSDCLSALTAWNSAVGEFCTAYATCSFHLPVFGHVLVQLVKRSSYEFLVDTLIYLFYYNKLLNLTLFFRLLFCCDWARRDEDKARSFQDTS